MLLKALVTTLSTAATTLRISKDVSIDDRSSQLVTVGQLQEMVNRLTDNNRILKDRIYNIGAVKVKLPLVKQYIGKKSKLKGFLA